jgi:hypothetical protein
MMIYMLAIAMTVAMLIATLFGLHQEAERVRVKNNNKRFKGFGIDPTRRPF